MILLIDSGSTKSDWVRVNKQGQQVEAYKTMGFNPFFHTSEVIEQEIRACQPLADIAQKIEEIYYYGAGCSQESKKEIVAKALSAVFLNAKILVDHDVKAAAFASYEGSPCISCILGTGSNAVYFDGTNMASKNAGLGYILGDEGSGSYFGKKLLAAYLYGQLPAAEAQALEKEFKLTAASIIEHVYEKPHANLYLAGFTRFIADHQSLPLFDTILYEGMHEFLKIHVCSFDGYEKVKTHFVGSVAFHFQKHIHRAAKDLNVQIGQIIQAPIARLLDYHVRYIFKDTATIQ